MNYSANTKTAILIGHAITIFLIAAAIDHYHKIGEAAASWPARVTALIVGISFMIHTYWFLHPLDRDDS